MNKKVEVLISCMYKDEQIIFRSNISNNVLLINQCDEEFYYEKQIFPDKIIRIFNTKERGLSKSRNMALKNSIGEFCLLCDDDEKIYDDFESKIIQAYVDLPDADLIAFQIDNAGKSYPKITKKINYLTALKIASWQITFRRKSILENNILFDESLGSGVSKAGGEENLFLYNCLKKGLNIYFVPLSIGRMLESDSYWFHGYNQAYFYDRGIFTKKLMGRFWATLYGLYYLIFKYSLYKNDVSLKKSFYSLFKGIYD